MSMIKKATNKASFSKIGLYGTAGSGKTFTAALTAINLVKKFNLPPKVAFFDTEPAASYVLPLFEEAGVELFVYDESRTLRALLEFIRETETEGFPVVIVDSISHVWRDAQKSYLDKVNQKRKNQNKPPLASLEFQHWGPIKEAWREFSDLYLYSRLHFILCGRAGQVYQYQKNEEKGKMELISTGQRMATEKELGHEPSLLVEMEQEREQTPKGPRITNYAWVEKDRFNIIMGRRIQMPTGETKLEKLLQGAWNAFGPHLSRINVGGQSVEPTADDSQDLYEDYGEGDWDHEKRQREIVCEEIKGLFIKHGLDGTSADVKKRRIALLEQVFGTTSWTKVENMRADRLREGFDELTAILGSPVNGSTEERPSDQPVN